MSMTVGDHVVKRLSEWGIKTVYAYPGDGINGLMGAMERQQESIRFVQVRHEELAAFMACAHSKFGGGVGVCLATSGPGAIHLLNGLYDAAMDNQPVVAIVGQSKRIAMGSDFQQEVDLQNLFKDVAREYCQTCMHPAQARTLVDRAIRIAQASRTVTCIIFPVDVQEADAVTEPPREHGASFTGVGHARSITLPDDGELDRAAELLNGASKVAILAGAGALGAEAELVETAERLGAGVAKALLGRAVLPDDLPFVTGSIGLLGTRPTDLMMQNCDALLMVGTSFPYSEWLPREGQARAVQIDLQPRKLSLRYPVEVPLHGDARATLAALLPRLEQKEDRAWRRGIEQANADWRELLDKRAAAGARPINPQRVFRALSPLLPDRAILTADSGSSAAWFARDLVVRRDMMASVSGNLATMGPALPYALAAKFVHPDRPVVAFVGDGAMQMLGNNVLIDVAKYWEEWEDPRLVVLVLANQDLNMVTWEERAMAGDPKFDASQVLPDFSFAAYARMLGLDAVEMRRPDDVERGWQQALAARRPVVVEAHVDPEVPPLPPHIDAEQARNFVASMIEGDPRAWRMASQALKQLWAGMG